MIPRPTEVHIPDTKNYVEPGGGGWTAGVSRRRGERFVRPEPEPLRCGKCVRPCGQAHTTGVTHLLEVGLNGQFSWAVIHLGPQTITL